MKMLKILIQVYFLSTGIVSNEKYKKYETYLYGVVLTNNGILIISLLMAFSRAKRIIHKIQIGSVLCCVTGVLIFKILAHVHKKYLLLTTSRLLENSKFGIDDLLDKLENKMNKKFYPLLIGVLFTFFILFNVTFLGFFTKSQIDYNDGDLYIVPELFVFSSVDSFGEYLRTVWLQTGLFFPEMVAYLSLTTFTCYVVASFEVHIEEIHEVGESFVYSTKIKSKIRTTMEQKSSPRGEARDCKLSKYLVNRVELKFLTLVRLQQYNFHYVKDFIYFGKFIFDAMLAWFFCTLILFIFMAFQVANDRVLLIKVGAVVINFLFVFFIICYSGEVICQMSASTMIELYNTTWYMLEPPLRRRFLTLMIVTQNHTQLKAFNMYPINLDLYAKTLKVVFSIVNGILLMQKKVIK